MYAAAATKSLRSCLTLCDPIDGSLPSFADPGMTSVCMYVCSEQNTKEHSEQEEYHKS